MIRVGMLCALFLLNNSCGSKSSFSSDSFNPLEKKSEQSDDASRADASDALTSTEELVVEISPSEGLSPDESNSQDPNMMSQGQDDGSDADATAASQDQGESSEDDEKGDSDESAGDSDESASDDAAEENPEASGVIEEDMVKIDSYLFENSKAFHLGNGRIGSFSYFNTDCSNRDDLISLPLAGRSLSLEVTIPEGASWEKLGIQSICGIDSSASLVIRDADGNDLLNEDLQKLQSSFEATDLDLGAGTYTVYIDPGSVFFDADDILIDDFQIYYKSENEAKIEITAVP